MLAGNDDIDFRRAFGNGGLDFADFQIMGNQAGGEAGRYRRHRNIRSQERLHGTRNEAMIDTDRPRRQRTAANAQLFQNIIADRMSRLRT